MHSGKILISVLSPFSQLQKPSLNMRIAVLFALLIASTSAFVPLVNVGHSRSAFVVLAAEKPKAKKPVTKASPPKTQVSKPSPVKGPAPPKKK
jgi:hypothetical protein